MKISAHNFWMRISLTSFKIKSFNWPWTFSQKPLQYQSEHQPGLQMGCSWERMSYDFAINNVKRYKKPRLTDVVRLVKTALQRHGERRRPYQSDSFFKLEWFENVLLSPGEGKAELEDFLRDFINRVRRYRWSNCAEVGNLSSGLRSFWRLGMAYLVIYPPRMKLEAFTRLT